VSTPITIRGSAGSTFRNVAAFLPSRNYEKISADVAPSNGSYTLSIDASKLVAGNNSIAVIAFSVPAGQTGGTSSTLNLTLNYVPASVNHVANSGFESGFASWSVYGQTAIATSGAQSGTSAARLISGTSAFEQVVTGLRPNTTYVLKAYVRKVSGSDPAIGAKDFGGQQVTVTSANLSYSLVQITFRTGASNTSAKIFFYSSNGSALADSFSLSAQP
jgi:hypothetical protein